MLYRKWTTTLRQLKGAAGTAGLMESCPRVEGFAMGIQFWRTPVRSLVLLALMLTGCATGGDLSTHDMPAIANRTYVLVGASSGFGQGVALKLAAHGANVVLAARRASLLEEIATQARTAGGTALVVPMDISKPEDVQRLADAAVSRYGRIDSWINFAGIGAIGPFWEVPVADHARVIDVNLKGVIYASHAALRVFRAQGYGTLINFGSVESEIPLSYHASYSSTKAGIRGLDEAINQELRLAGLSRINVVTVEPWAVNTPFWVHAANYTGKAPCMAAMDDAEKVVDATIWVSLYPQPELPVGWKAQMAWFSHHIMPHFTERLAADIAHRYQIATGAPAPTTEGSLFTPVEAGRGVRGGACEQLTTGTAAEDARQPR
jgi:short-subunit dehydrogenase